MAELTEIKENELCTLLQNDEKGWKVNLFEDQNNILHALCANCGGVCRDPVELACDHIDNDISLHCKQCMTDLIDINSGNCPINNHSNPIVVKNRAMKRLIVKSMVLCPYSIEYKQRILSEINIENAEIIDTNGADEKEGMNPMILSEIKGCNFKGQIDDLLQNHILNCIKIYNPSYIQNITINKLKKENDKLKKTVIQLKKQNDKFNQQKQFEQENKILTTKNQKLQKQLSVAKDTILCLQMIIEQQKELNNQKQSNVNFEEKKNEATDEMLKQTVMNLNKFWCKCGANIKINGTRIDYKGNFANTAYSLLLTDGVYRVKLKVIQNSGAWIYIGIASTANESDSYFYTGPSNKGDDEFNYAYKSTGDNFSSDSAFKKHCDLEKYGVNDVITLYLDYNNCTISFGKNDVMYSP
eukprot:460396_1